MRLFSFSLLFFLGTLLLAATAPSEAPAATFADGLIHVIDVGNGFPREGLDILDDPAGVATTVVVISGGEVATEVNALSRVRGGSRLVISGGAIGGRIQLFDRAELLVEAGRIRDLAAGGASLTTIFGGITTGVLRSTDQAALFISGGSGTARILVSGQSEVSFQGFDFELPPGEVVLAGGTIRGTRQDGNSLSAPFGRTTDARIFLVESSLLDADGDGLGDGVDFCPFFASEDQTDSNADGRGDICQCGDGDADGEITSADMSVVVMCSVGIEPCDSSIVDADGDGITTALDIGGVSAVINGAIPPVALICSRATP